MLPNEHDRSLFLLDGASKESGGCWDKVHVFVVLQYLEFRLGNAVHN